MFFLSFLVGLVTVVTAGGFSLPSSELKKYEEKLRKYQHMTNIDESTFNSIRTTGLSNGKFIYTN